MLVQPFGLASPGGGARILRSLCAAPPTRTISVAVSLSPPPDSGLVEELHIRRRPYLRRLRGTRLGPAIGQLDDPGHARVEKHLTAVAEREHVRAVHALADDQISFALAHRVARRVGARFTLSVHDAPWYKRQHLQLGNQRFFAALARAWRDADARMVISQEMGTAFVERYGHRPFNIVTDGLDRVSEAPLGAVPNEFVVYFTGSIHLAHHENFLILIEALGRLRSDRRWLPRLVLRGSDIPSRASSEFVEFRPWAPDAEVAREAESAHLLYLPLPFGNEHKEFTSLSLPTKLITYLGSGRPIVYHGPQNAAAARLLRESEGGLLVEHRDPLSLARLLDQWLASDAPAASARRALDLARSDFLADRQREVFWSALVGRSIQEVSC
jgi:Glycosyl transferases group 1